MKVLMEGNMNIISNLTVKMSSLPLPQFHKVERAFSCKSEKPIYTSIGRWNDCWVIGGTHKNTA